MSKITEYVAALLSAGGHDAQDPGHELTACGAVGPVTRLPPADGVADGPLGRVVGRLNPGPGGSKGVRRSDIEEMQPSKTSMMPNGLLDTMSESEVLDLLAFLLSRGDRESPMFQ